jgi:hypothetical protein
MENNEKPKEGKLENEKQVEGSKPTGSEKEKNNQKEESKATLPTKSPVPPESTKKEEEARYLLFFVYGETTPIDRGDIFDLIDQLNKIPTPPEQTRIDMIILSGGGYPHPAYQMVNIIRSRCKKLKAIVPLYAKSAATLMTLGSDEIVMGAQSELGPLDMQMQHPLIENLHISALEGYYPFLQLYSKVSTEFFPIALQLADQIIQRTAIKREDAVDIAINTAINYITPIVSQINPTIVNMCYRALATGEVYAYNFLYRYMFKDKPDNERMLLATQTSHALVWGFQNHGQVITRDDAKLLNLYVGFGENYDLFDMMYVITKEMLNILSTSQQTKAIRVISMNQLKSLLNIDSYLGYITFIMYKAYSLVSPIKEQLENVTDQKKISLTIRQALSQSLTTLPPKVPENEKKDIAQVSLELLELIFLKNFKEENALYKVIYNRINKERAFSKKVSEVIAGRIVEAVKELNDTIEIEIDRTPPEVVSKYILQILAFLLVYNIKF